MVNFTELVQSAKNKGLEIDAYTTIASRCYDRKNPVEDFKLNSSIYGFGRYYENMTTTVTIKITDSTFATWEFFGADYNYGFFSIYSQVSGHTMRSFNQERKALKKLGI